MARYFCERCKADCNTLDEPHLCKDLKKRYERNKKAIEIVSDIVEKFIEKHGYDPTYSISPDKLEEVSAEIVKALSGRDLGVD